MGNFLKVFLVLLLFAPFSSYSQDLKKVQSLGFDGVDAQGWSAAGKGCKVKHLYPGSLGRQLGLSEGNVIIKYGHQYLIIGCEEIDPINQWWKDDGQPGEIQITDGNGGLRTGSIAPYQYRLAQQNLNPEKRNNKNGTLNDPVLGAARKFIANGQREQFVRAEKAQKEQRAKQEKEWVSPSLSSAKSPRFIPQSKSENNTGSEDRLAGQPQEQGANNPSEERKGIFSIPVLGPFLKGMADGLPAQGARVSEALQDAPSAYVDRKISEEKDRRERRKREAEERKKQEEIAKQEQERVASLAKRDQEAREAQARIDEEQKKQRAKQEEERNRQEQYRLALLEFLVQSVRLAQARADEERKQREAQARNNTGNSVSPPIASTQPVAQKPPQPSPQVITQQPTNGQSGGPISPSIGATPSSPMQPSSNPQQTQVKASVEYAKPVPKIEFNARPIDPLPLSNKRGLTPQEVTWKNSLPSDIRQRIDQFSPDMIARMKQNGHWDIFVRGVNNDAAALREARRDEALAWGEFAFNVVTLPGADVRVLALALSKGPVIASTAVKAGKSIFEIASENAAGKSAARGIDTVAENGTNRTAIHHICTNKNCTSTARGGPWTPRFEAIFEKAGMTLEDGLNKVSIPGHKGPHPEAYHQAVYDRLVSATSGLSGSAYKVALETELRRIGKEAVIPGTLLNRLITKQ